LSLAQKEIRNAFLAFALLIFISVSLRLSPPLWHPSIGRPNRLALAVAVLFVLLNASSIGRRAKTTQQIMHQINLSVRRSRSQNSISTAQIMNSDALRFGFD